MLKRGATWLLGIGLLLTPLMAASAEEQDRPRPSKWWLAAEGRAAVGITDAQSAKIERIFQSVVLELRGEKAELERQEKELTRLLGTDGADEAVVIRTIDRVEAARSALAKTRTLMLYRMRRVLSPEQRVRLDAYHNEQERVASDTRQDNKF